MFLFVKYIIMTNNLYAGEANLVNVFVGKILNYISYGAKTKTQVSNRINKYLLKFDLPNSVKQNIYNGVINRIYELGYLKKERYVSDILDTILNSSKKISIIKIKKNLIKKGLDLEDINEIINNLTDEYIYESALKDFEKKLKYSKNKIILKNFLISNGHSINTIEKIFNEKNL